MRPTVEHKPEWNWIGRSLVNYKAMQARAARDKGVLPQLEAAPTLTEARKIVYGQKKGATRSRSAQNK